MSNPTPESITALLRDRADPGAVLERVLLGVNWSVAQCGSGTGLCFSASAIPRNLSWPGSLAGRPVASLLPWLDSRIDIEVAAAVAAVNASVNTAANPLLQAATPLHFEAAQQLSVFAHFLPTLAGAQVVVIGRYPGMDRFLPSFDYLCVERQPGPGELPAQAAESALARADWVFITASSLANGSLAQLLRWSRNARTVLMGPTLPWLPDWADFGVDYLAGVEVCDSERLTTVAAEAGGTRIFTAAVRYRLLQLG